MSRISLFKTLPSRGNPGKSPLESIVRVPLAAEWELEEDLISGGLGKVLCEIYKHCS